MRGVVPKKRVSRAGTSNIIQQYLWDTIDPFHNNFSPSGKQLEHRKLAHEFKQQTDGCIAIFHKYYCYTKRGSVTTNLSLRNNRGYVSDVSKFHYAGIGHGWKRITFYVQKRIATLERCHNQLLVPDKPLGVPTSVKQPAYLPVAGTLPFSSK